jgi:3-hydroxypropanoate dehydrogenase
MRSTLTDEALNEIFREARTHGAWLDKPVSDEILRQLYDLMKWGPTSANGSPVRFVFLRTPEAKEGLRPALAPGNVEKTMTAPRSTSGAKARSTHGTAPSLWLL